MPGRTRDRLKMAAETERLWEIQLIFLLPSITSRGCSKEGIGAMDFSPLDRASVLLQQQKQGFLVFRQNVRHHST